MTTIPLPKKTLSAALWAALALTAAAPAAHAQVITYGGPPIPITQSIDGLYLNVVTGNTSVGNAGWDLNIYDNNTRISFWAPAVGGYLGSGTEVSLLAAGSVVGPAGTYLTAPNIGGDYAAPPFEAGTTGYFGFRFLNEAAGTTHYGWAQLSTGSDAGFPATLVTYAFELTPDTAITVVPEPGSYALMLLGMAAVGGMVARRRRPD